MRHLLKHIILWGSLIWAGVMIWHVDLPECWRQLPSDLVGIRLVVLAALFLLPSTVTQWAETLMWVATFGGRAPLVGFSRMFAIRLAGEALNQATPFMSLGGEPVKAVLLTAAGEGASQGAAAVMSSRLVMTVTQAGYACTAVVMGLWLEPSRKELIPFAVFPGVIGLIIIGMWLARVVLPRAWQRWIAERPLARRHRGPLLVIRDVLDLWRRHPRQFVAALLFSTTGWLVLAAEFWLVGWVLGLPVRWEDALVMEGLMNSVNMATFFIPGNLGSQESGLLFLGQTFQLARPVTATMLVLRRLREVAWVALGFLCLAALGGTKVSSGEVAPAGEAR